MTRSFGRIVLILGAAALIALPALAQEPGMIVLYKGTGAVNDDTAGAVATAGTIVGGWGAGTCHQVDDVSYGDLGGSLKVTTEGYYEGARLDFRPAVDMTSAFQTPDTYLRFAVKFPSSGNTAGGGYNPAPMMPGMPGGPPGMETAPAYMGTGDTEAPGSPGTPYIRQIRVVLYLDNGDVLATTPQVVDISKPALKGWAWMSLPLKAFKSTRRAGTIPSRVAVKRMVICGNTKDTMHIGEIRTEMDNEPIGNVSAGDDQVVAANEPVVFQGSADSKVTPLKYSWDFDDKDGISDEASGPVVVHRFTKPGVYKVTLTVTDPMGLKTPATATATIEVND